jgi:paraquat-inducible protein A
MPSRHPSWAQTISIWMLPVSLALYAYSLSMDVAVLKTTITVFGISKTTDSPYRLLTVIRDLWRDGDTALSIIIASFTILFPVSKYVGLFYVLLARAKPARATVLTWITNLGQWSMGDVFVVATLVVVLRLNTAESLAHLTLKVKPGLYVFAASVIMSMIVSALLATVPGVTAVETASVDIEAAADEARQRVSA